MPHASNFDSNISWFRVSKAFDKSRNIPAKYFWQSTALATLFTKLIKAWEVEWPGRVWKTLQVFTYTQLYATYNFMCFMSS